MHAVHHTAQVDVDDPVPVRQQQFAGLAADADAGVVHHQVQSAVPVAGLVDQGLDRAGVAYVDRHGRGGPRPALGQVTRGPFGPVLVGVGHHHRVSPGHQRGGQGLPDTRGGPGDDCDPAHDDLRSPPVLYPKASPARRYRHHPSAASGSEGMNQHPFGKLILDQSRSMMVAVAMAPPAHMVTRAVPAPRRSSSCSAVVSSRAPVLPTGWPRAIAPPLTFTRSGSAPCIASQDSTIDANASLTSNRSMSPMAMPLRWSTRSVAWTGPSRW